MSKFANVAILGTGAFGVALTRLVAQKNVSTSWWGRNESVCQSINETRHHPSRLPQVRLPDNVIATTDLERAVRHADCVISAVPMEAFSSVLADVKSVVSEDAIIVSSAKGIVEKNLHLPCDVVHSILPKAQARRACYLSGPSFAIELAMDLPTALTVASLDHQALLMVQTNLSSRYCRLYRSDDIIGVSVGGALKNVIAIAAGACTGLGLGRNALASLITRGLAEMARLATSLKGRASTLSGLCGAGDLILSCTDDMSRNHRLGTLLADGYELDVALAQIGSVVEGAKTAQAIPKLEQKYGIELPICHAVFQVLYEGISAKEAISSLLERSLKEEGL